MRELVLAYGKGSQRLRVAEELAPEGTVLAARAPPPRDPGALYGAALAAAGWSVEGPVAVVVPDETRPAARDAALAALDELLGDHDVEVVVGAGLHPRGAPPPCAWPTRVHDPGDPGLVSLGRAAGINVRVDAGVARARTVIVVGCVMPHYLAGFSGGPKGLVPGVAAEETIVAVHARADRARNGEVEGNPFAEAIRACAALVPGQVLHLNLLVGPRGPFAATAEPHERAVGRYRAACGQERPAPADVVVADAGGHPADATLLQAHKAYEAAAGLAKPSGTIVLVAACDGGYGHPEFERRLFDPKGPFHPYARTATEWWRKAESYRTRMVTEMDVTRLGVERVDLATAVADIPTHARVLWATAAQDLLFH